MSWQCLSLFWGPSQHLQPAGLPARPAGPAGLASAASWLKERLTPQHFNKRPSIMPTRCECLWNTAKFDNVDRMALCLGESFQRADVKTPSPALGTTFALFAPSLQSTKELSTSRVPSTPAAHASQDVPLTTAMSSYGVSFDSHYVLLLFKS